MDGALTGIYNSEVRHPRRVGSTTKNFCVRHMHSNTTILFLWQVSCAVCICVLGEVLRTFILVYEAVSCFFEALFVQVSVCVIFV